MSNRTRRECVLRTNDELTLIQYTGRPCSRRLIPGAIKIKPTNGLMHVVEPVEPSTNFDTERAEHLARVVDGHDASQTNRTYQTGRFDHLTLEGERQATKGTYCAAIVKNGKVILFPVKQRYQLRPRLRHMDRADQQLKATMIKDDSTDDDEPVEKAPVRARVVPKTVTQIKPDTKGYQARKEKIIEEEWRQLDTYPAEQLQETYDETESRRKLPEICSTLGYLDKLSQMKIEHVVTPKRKVPIRDSLVEHMWNGAGYTQSDLANQFPAATKPEMMGALGQLCWLVKGYWTLKGQIRYRNETKWAQARDRVCFAISNGSPEPFSQSKKTATQHLAKFSSAADSGWQLLREALPENENDPLTQSMKSALVARASELKTRHSSPGRSPGRPASSISRAALLSGVKVETQAESVKSELEASGAIFTGQQRQESIESYKNELSDFFKLRGICIEVASVVYDQLNLDGDLKLTDQLSLGANRALVKCGDRIAYCNNEKEIALITAYRQQLMGSQTQKVKRKELLAAVIAMCEEKETITEKMFDLYLRQFCYTSGQSWLLKPKL